MKCGLHELEMLSVDGVAKRQCPEMRTHGGSGIPLLLSAVVAEGRANVTKSNTTRARMHQAIDISILHG